MKTDTTTQGTWKGAYGADGFDISQDSSSNNPTIPSYATVNINGAGTGAWALSTTDVRGLQKGALNSTDRIAAAWYTATSFSVDVRITDGQSHQVALYAVDWDHFNRNETISVVDDASGTVLDTRTIGNFDNGVYLVWSVKGSVTFRVTNNVNGSFADLNGFFFSTPTPPLYKGASASNSPGQLNTSGGFQTSVPLDSGPTVSVALNGLDPTTTPPVQSPTIAITKKVTTFDRSRSLLQRIDKFSVKPGLQAMTIPSRVSKVESVTEVRIK